jgi:hypothetical protein
MAKARQGGNSGNNMIALSSLASCVKDQLYQTELLICPQYGDRIFIRHFGNAVYISTALSSKIIIIIITTSNDNKKLKHSIHNTFFSLVFVARHSISYAYFNHAKRGKYLSI